MSSTASVPNSFANAVTATGAQLDANYTTIVAYLNDPTNRNNYAADGAATNTVVLTFSPPVVGGYTAGLDLCWKWGQTNTGAVQANANGLGLINVVNPDGSALQPGQGVQGSIGRGVYDGTRAIYITPPSPASKAAMQTATAAASFVTPAQTQNHPGVSKAWAFITRTATAYTLLDAYNVSSVGRAGTGTITINFTTPFTTTTYPALVSAAEGSVGNVFMSVVTKTTTSCVVIIANSAATATADSAVNFVAFGTQ